MGKWFGKSGISKLHSRHVCLPRTLLWAEGDSLLRTQVAEGERSTYRGTSPWENQPSPQSESACLVPGRNLLAVEAYLSPKGDKLRFGFKGQGEARQAPAYG